MRLLALTDICCRLRDGARQLSILEGVSFDVHAGELIGIYGERRSGKSTLLQIAAGLRAPDSGAVEFDGRDVTALSNRERPSLWRRGGIGLASGDVRPFATGCRALEHVALPLTSEGFTLGESEALARATLDHLGVAGLAHERVERLTLSDRIRVELARTLVREPRVLLVDEPAVLPGPSDSRRLQGSLRGLASEHGIAVLIASEDMTALSGVHRFMTLGGGRLRCTDSRRQVIQFPGPRGGERQRRKA